MRLNAAAYGVRLDLIVATLFAFVNRRVLFRPSCCRQYEEKQARVFLQTRNALKCSKIAELTICCKDGRDYSSHIN